MTAPRLLLFTAILLAASPGARASNPPGGILCQTGPCPGDDSTAMTSSACDGPMSASLDWGIKVGLARYPKPASFTDLGQAAFEKNGNLPTFKEVFGRYFPASPLQQTQIRLELS